MHARSTTIQARPADIDAGLRHIRDTVLPALERIDGFTGMSCMCDRQSGKCVVTTAWRTEDAMRSSAAGVVPLRDRAAQLFGASGAEVDEWEIAVLHRDHSAHEGACGRAVWTRTNPANIDHAIETFKTMSMPRMEGQAGFTSASLLVNRTTGRCAGLVAFDSLESLRRNYGGDDSLRSQISRESGMEVTEIREFELAMTQLRVPELV